MRCVRLSNADVVRSNAAKGAARIFEEMAEEEAAAEPKTRGGGLAANALGALHSGTASGRGSASTTPQELPLPEGWAAFTDTTTGKPYYFNQDTNVTCWDLPPMAVEC